MKKLLLIATMLITLGAVAQKKTDSTKKEIPLPSQGPSGPPSKVFYLILPQDNWTKIITMLITFPSTFSALVALSVLSIVLVAFQLFLILLTISQFQNLYGFFYYLIGILIRRRSIAQDGRIKVLFNLKSNHVVFYLNFFIFLT